MIVIPMAGASSRFMRAGYDRPKYEIELGGQTLFERAVCSFRAYFRSEIFVFVVRPGFDAARFVQTQATRLGITRFHVVEVGPTRGQAETVALGLQKTYAPPDERVVIFNIDTIRPSLVLPVLPRTVAGYLEVFHASGTHWSFVLPAADGHQRVARTAEKERISGLCCTGLYIFSRAQQFEALVQAALPSTLSAPADAPGWQPDQGSLGPQSHPPTRDAAPTPAAARELYVAPLYNALIGAGQEVRYGLVPAADVLLCGTPEEHAALRLAQGW